MWTIVRGGYEKAIFRIKDLTTKDPYKFTVNHSFAIYLANADGTFLELTDQSGLTLDTSSEGKFEAEITPAQSALLKVQTNAALELHITDPDGNKFVHQIPLAYTVLDKLST